MYSLYCHYDQLSRTTCHVRLNASQLQQLRSFPLLLTLACKFTTQEVYTLDPNYWIIPLMPFMSSLNTTFLWTSQNSEGLNGLEMIVQLLHFGRFLPSKLRSLNTALPGVINHFVVPHSPKLNLWNKLKFQQFPWKSAGMICSIVKYSGYSLCTGHYSHWSASTLRPVRAKKNGIEKVDLQ